MAEEFKPGDVVVLKSGGPRMTVTSVRGSDAVVCTWFVEGKEVKEYTFPATALGPAKPGSEAFVSGKRRI